MSRPHLAIIVTHPVTARFLLGGQLTYLAHSGVDVELITSPGPHLDAICSNQDIECSAIKMAREIRPASDLLAFARLLKHLRRSRPDAVSASTPKAALLGLAAAALARVPVRIYTVRGLRQETTRGLKRWVLFLAERIAAHSAHHIVMVSESLKRRYSDLGLAPGRSLRILGAGSSNGVDCFRFQPRSLAGISDHLAADLGIDLSSPVVGFVGRLVKDKGVEDLLKAFAEFVQPRFPTVQLLLVGSWEAGDPVSDTTRRRTADDSAIFQIDFVDDSAPWYRLMDVLAFPSYREGFPNAPLEAAASGIPVVAYAATGTVDAVENEVSGSLVPNGDYASLGRAICRYLDSQALRDAHGKAGRDRALEFFSQELVWTAWRDFYWEVLGGLRDGSPE